MNDLTLPQASRSFTSPDPEHDRQLLAVLDDMEVSRGR